MLTAAQAHRRMYIRKTIGTLVPILILTIGIAVGVSNLGSIREFFIGATGDKANIQGDTQAILLCLAHGEIFSKAVRIKTETTTTHPTGKGVKTSTFVSIMYTIFMTLFVDRLMQFNWAKMDPVVSDILAVGAKPYISLSYLYRNRSKDIIWVHPIETGDCAKTVEHFSKKRE